LAEVMDRVVVRKLEAGALSILAPQYLMEQFPQFGPKFPELVDALLLLAGPNGSEIMTKKEIMKVWNPIQKVKEGHYKAILKLFCDQGHNSWTLK
jgi:hypothetical protein